MEFYGKDTKYFHIYDDRNGDYFKIKATLENLANIIATNYTNDLKIYDDHYTFVVSTIGNFLDRVCDMDFRERLLNVLLPLQLGEKDTKEVKRYA